MHLFDTFTLFTVLTLVGVELSVAAFVNPAAWLLDPQPQLRFLSRVAAVLGKVMPVWYPLAALLLFVQTRLRWHEANRSFLLAAGLIWAFASVASIFFLVPLNTQIAEGKGDWQRTHRVWDRRHRLRTAALSISAFLLAYAMVR